MKWVNRPGAAARCRSGEWESYSGPVDQPVAGRYSRCRTGHGGRSYSARRYRRFDRTRVPDGCRGCPCRTGAEAGAHRPGRGCRFDGRADLPETNIFEPLGISASSGVIAPVRYSRRWVVYGDSICQGWSVSEAGLAWPSLVAERLSIDTIDSSPPITLIRGLDLLTAEKRVDGIHPGDRGHAALAAAVLPTVARQLSRRF